MKTKLTILKLVIASCTFATTAAFGQVLYQWTGAGDPTNVANANNWTPSGGPPSGATQDTGQWIGTPSGNINITYTAAGGLPGTGFGTSGVNWELTAAQVGSVTWISPVNNSQNIGFNNITLDSGCGPLVLGNDVSPLNQLNFIGRPAGGVHAMINNSASSATINQSVRWQAGGGSAYVLDFQGTGNWIINNYLRNDNGSGPTTVALEGPGMLTWSSDDLQRGNSPTGPVIINGGTMILKSPNLVPFENPATVPGGNDTIANNGLLEFDAPAQSDNIARVISGIGPVQVNNGTWTFSGQNTFTASITLAGGELIAGTPETLGVSGPLGVGNTISFTGGTLGFTANNAFDYSSQFSTAAGQAYSFDTGGQSVTFATGLGGSSSTVTKVGPGTLTLAGTSSYGGATTVSGGRLLFQGSKTGTGNISVADNAILTVAVTGTQVTPNTLAVGTSSGATLGFNGVTSTTTAPIAAGTLTSAGTTTININSGTFAVGSSYPLLTWTTGSAPTATIGILNGFVGNLSVTGNTLFLNITATAFSWTGANNSAWDTTTLNNWLQNGASAVYANNGTPAFFDDTATGPTSVTIGALVTPPNVTINNSSKTYSIASSTGKDIGGSASLTKSGSGLLTLSGGANAYTGVTTLSGGTLSVSTLANGGTASDIGAAANSAANLVLDGGTLSYTGGAASADRLFSISTGGGTIDVSGSGALNLNNAGAVGFVGSGARLLNLTGTSSGTLAASLADNGGPTAVTVSSTNTTWILTGNNTESGQTTINAGTLQIGNGGATGAIGTGNIDDESSLDFNSTGTVTVNGAISGAGALTNDGSGTVILVNNNSFLGNVVINAGTLQIGNGGPTGSLNNNVEITNNGVLVVNTTGNFNLNGDFAGTGSFTKMGTGVLKLLGTEEYTGVTTVASGGVLQIFSGNQGVFGPGTIVVNGTLNFVRQDTGVAGISGVISGTGTVTMDSNNDQPGDLTISNNCTYTGGTTIKAGAIILGDGLTSGFGSIVGNVNFAPPGAGATARSLTFNRPDNYTFPGTIGGNNNGSVIQQGLATVTLTGNNTYTNGTTVTTGTLQVGNGGTSGTIGTGPVTDNSVLVFDRSDNLTFGGAISGTGSLVQSGTGILTLTGTNTIAGSTTVSNGTLVASSSGSDLDVMSGASLAPGGLGTVGNLSVGGSLNMTSGTLLVTLNEASSPSNSTVTVAITTTITSSTLKLLNYGPSLNVGDTFTIFSGPVTGITTIVSPGYTFANNLAVDGSVKVTAVAPPGSTITSTVSGGNLNLTWPADLTGLNLQVQTNTLAVGLKNNWITIPGTAAGNTYSAPLNRTTNTCVFYRLSPQ